MTEQFHDARRTYTFYMDDAVLDVFGPRIGAYGVAVYALLARHARLKEAFPSYKHIQRQLGIGRMTVVRTLAALKKEGLLLIDTRHTPVGDYDTKLYTLCDLSSFHGGGTSERPPGTSERPPGTSERPGVVPVRDQGGTCERPPLEGISLKGSQGKEKDPPSPPSEGPSPAALTPDWLMLLYNQATPPEHPKVRTLSPARREKATKYVRIFPDAAFWQTVMQEVSDSAFLLGRKPSEGHEGFVADFDWLLTKGKDGTENCLKVAEGKYRDGPLDGFSPAQRRHILAAQRSWNKEQDGDDPGAVSEVFDRARNARRRLRGPSGGDPPKGLLGTDA